MCSMNVMFPLCSIPGIFSSDKHVFFNFQSSAFNTEITDLVYNTDKRHTMLISFSVKIAFSVVQKNKTTLKIENKTRNKQKKNVIKAKNFPKLTKF